MPKKGVKMGLGDFLGTVDYTVQGRLPTGPRAHVDGEEDRRGPPGGRRRYEDDEPSRSEQVDSWRGSRQGGDRMGGDRFGGGGGGGDRFGGGGGDRFDRRGPSTDSDAVGNWRGGGGGAGGERGFSRFDGPPRREAEERPSHMRLALKKRTNDSAPEGSSANSDSGPGASSRSNNPFGSARPVDTDSKTWQSNEGGAPAAPARESFRDRGAAPTGGEPDDKWSKMFGGGGNSSGGRFSDRRGGNDRFAGRRDRDGPYGGERFGGDHPRDDGDRFGRRNDRFGGDRQGDDRDGGDRFRGGNRFGDRFGDRREDRFGDRREDRFGDRREDRNENRNEDSRENINDKMSNLKVEDKKQEAPRSEESSTKKEPEAKVEKEAEDEARLAELKKAEEEKRKAEEAKEAQKKALDQLAACGKVGKDLVAHVKEQMPSAEIDAFADLLYKLLKNTPSAKESSDWAKPENLGEFIRLTFGKSEADELHALYAIQHYFYDISFPKGLLMQVFQKLYENKVIFGDSFMAYKDDINDDVPGKMKAIIQVTSWLAWLEAELEKEDYEEEEYEELGNL